MAKIIIIGALPESLLNFRGELIKTFESEGHEVIAMGCENVPRVRAALSDMGVRFKAYPVQRNSMNPLKDLHTFLALRKTFKELKPDIVLSYTIKPVIWSGLALYASPRIRFYALISGLGFAFQNGGFFRKLLSSLVTGLYRISLARSMRVIFQNPDNLQFFISKNILNKKKGYIVNGSGVDLANFKKTSPPLNGIVFLTIGRLLWDKGFGEYAKAASIVKKHYPNTVFRLLGPTDPSPDGISLDTIQEWEGKGAIEYLGSTDDVRPYLTGCHIYVLPSYHEGLPRTVIEAMATGRPILTTDVPGCRETVVPGKNGYLVPKADAKALAERMIWFIEHTDQWQQMGQASRCMAEERFDVNKVNAEMMRIMNIEISKNDQTTI